MELLKIANLSLHFGGIVALSNLSMSVKGGEIHAVIGPNGAGKTSLFNCISGVYRPSEGEIVLKRHEHHPPQATPEGKTGNRPYLPET